MEVRSKDGQVPKPLLECLHQHGHGVKPHQELRNQLLWAAMLRQLRKIGRE
jgi:hypothetical protein